VSVSARVNWLRDFAKSRSQFTVGAAGIPGSTRPQVRRDCRGLLITARPLPGRNRAPGMGMSRFAPVRPVHRSRLSRSRQYSRIPRCGVVNDQINRLPINGRPAPTSAPDELLFGSPRAESFLSNRSVVAAASSPTMFPVDLYAGDAQTARNLCGTTCGRIRRRRRARPKSASTAEMRGTGIRPHSNHTVPRAAHAVAVTVNGPPPRRARATDSRRARPSASSRWT
jgi:hypothetical protein